MTHHVYNFELTKKYFDQIYFLKNSPVQPLSMVVDGFLRNGDALVIDNASIHCYRDSAVLEEILWEDYKILLIFMPTRSPELNPIELMWNILVQHLRRVPLTGRHTSERNGERYHGCIYTQRSGIMLPKV